MENTNSNLVLVDINSLELNQEKQIDAIYNSLFIDEFFIISIEFHIKNRK